MAEGSPKVVVLGEESASIPLTPSIARESVSAGMSRREGSAAIGAGGNPSLALTSVGSDLPMRGKPLLRWASLEDPTSMLFTLDDATKSMERESLDVGIVSMLEALDHAMGAFARCCHSLWLGICLILLLALSFLHIFLYSDHHFPSVPHRS